MNKVLIGVLLGGLLATIGSSLYFNFQNKKEILNDEVLLSRYPNGFVTKSIGIEESLITFSFDNPGWENTDSPNYNSPPIAYLLDDTGNNAYEIVFETTTITDNDRFLRLDIDEDGQDEIISEWVGHSMGSGGLKGLVIWKLENDKLVPLAGYPQDKNKNSLLTVKGLETDQPLTFPSIDWYSYTDYKENKLYLAQQIWNLEAKESRNSPHIWKLQVFKFENGEFIKDSDWNNGEDLLTKEKILPNDEGYPKIKEIFYSF